MNKYKNFEDWWELEAVKMTILRNFPNEVAVTKLVAEIAWNAAIEQSLSTECWKWL